MNRQKFTGIILLMALSLIGIISVQLFWMKKAITIKEEQFDQQVNQALSRASQRIERNQNAYFMSNLFAGMPHVQFQQKMNINNNNQTTDSIFIEFSNFWEDKSQKVHVLKANNNKVLEKEENGLETIKYTFDTIIEDGGLTQRIQTFSQVTKPKNRQKNVINNSTINNDSVAKPMKKQLNDVMDQMMLEFSVRDIPMEERLNNTIIAPTIEYELKNFDIPLKFEYAITNYQGSYYNKLKTNGFDKNKASKAYKTILFPNDILMQSDKLVLYFPNKRNYLINNLIWPFAGSLVFTLIILFTFYFTLKTIYNQKKVSEIKTDFINNMTHEFKTPIATISLAADSINNPNIINYPDKVSRFTKIIKEENYRMNRQVESVLKMAIIDKKDFNLNLMKIEVNPLIQQAVKNISLQVEQNGGKVELYLSAENDKLEVDETHFVNLVYNLLDNANKYSLNAPPEIKVSSYSSNDSFYFSVADKGIGMNKETLDNIFEKFYRETTGNIHTVKGFGLGLSYVKVIVMQFKGDISVNSQKGKGSEFTIRIPL